MYISIRYINSERIPRFSHESRFEFLNEIDRRTEREGLNPCPHSLLSYPLFRVETTRMQQQWWEDYRNRINRCFLRNRRVAIIGSGATPFLDSIKRNLPGGLSCSPRWDQFSLRSESPLASLLVRSGSFPFQRRFVLLVIFIVLYSIKYSINRKKYKGRT